MKSWCHQGQGSSVTIASVKPATMTSDEHEISDLLKLVEMTTSKDFWISTPTLPKLTSEQPDGGPLCGQRRFQNCQQLSVALS